MPITRRRFVKRAAATAVALPAMPALARRPRNSANEDIRVAVIGIRSRGRAHIDALHALENVRVVALCDVDKKVLGEQAKRLEERGGKAETFTDMRAIMDRGDIDAVATATPNHWHALLAVWACQSGKDVYLEKPVSHNVWEGRQIVKAARKHGRIVQTGTQSRSSIGITEAVAWLREGHLGGIVIARGFCYKPRRPIGNVSGPQTVPDHIDYDLWTGPAPMKPLMRKNLHYDWHWVFDTGNGDLGNQGIHQMDICRWAIGAKELAPAVGSVGGRFGYEDDGNTPNTQLVWLDYEPAPILFEVRGLPKSKQAQRDSWNGGGMDRYKGQAIGVIIECEDGHLAIPNYNEAIAYDAAGAEVKRWKGSRNHFENFIDAVRSRSVETLTADIEEGHLSSAMCHVGNISYGLGQPAPPAEVREQIAAHPDLADRSEAADSFDRFCAHLDANEVDLEKTPATLGPWLTMDPATERFTNNPHANALLTRDYRKPFVVPTDV